MAALHVTDEREGTLPDVGLILVKDAETGSQQWVDTSDASVRQAYANNFRKKTEELKTTFTRCGVDTVTVRTDEDYVKSLLRLFQQRG